MSVQRLPLRTIAHGRSGDKGNHANIAVIAYTPAGFAWLRANLSVEVVQRYFASLQPSRIARFEAPNLHALNFLLYDVLAGGASRSLRSDTQGKTLALALLNMPVELPDPLTDMRRPGEIADQVCGLCGRNLLRRMGPDGPIARCSGYPVCEFTVAIPHGVDNQ